MAKVTMLGTGLIGMFYAMTLNGNRSRDQVEVVYSRLEERAQEFARKWNIPRRTTDLADAVNDPATQVVVIGLPNNLHEQSAVLAAEAGNTGPLISLEMLDRFFKSPYATLIRSIKTRFPNLKIVQ